MRHGSAVFRELLGAQKRDVLDTLERPRAVVGAELAVAEHREAFLEAQLEPVTAGDTVARPVVEVFVRHHRRHPLEPGVGGGGRVGEHAAGIEDVEALVLHGAHVEVVHGHNHVAVEVVLQPVVVLVPAHGVLECLHGVIALVEILGLHVDEQFDGAAGGGDVAVAHVREVAGHQRKQVGRLGKRVLPGGPVASVAVDAVGHQVAVGQQHRKPGALGTHCGGEARQHIGAIQIPGDLAKALGLALGAEQGARTVQAFQRGVVDGVDQHLGGEGKTLGDIRYVQPVGVDAVFIRRQNATVNGNGMGAQLFAVQYQLGALMAAVRIATHLQRRLDPGFPVVQIKIQIHVVDQVTGYFVVFQIDRAGLGVAHDWAPDGWAAEQQVESVRRRKTPPGTR